eukprot:scaffold37640_cov83-Cyclotella_meneghiniana.AAC.7
MAATRVALLDELGFDWGTNWYANFRELCKFREEHGHCKVPTRDKTLGRWVTSQRSDYKNNKIAQEKIDKLNELGFVWNYDGANRSE